MNSNWLVFIKNPRVSRMSPVLREKHNLEIKNLIKKIFTKQSSIVNWAQMQEQHHQYLVPLVFNNDDFASARNSLIYPRSFVRGCREISSRFARRRGFCPRSRKPRGAWPLADSEWSTPIISFVSTVCLPGSCNISARPSVLQALWKSPSIRQRNLRLDGLCARWSVTYWFRGDLSAVRVKARFFWDKRFSQEVNKERETNELVQKNSFYIIACVRAL